MHVFFSLPFRKSIRFDARSIEFLSFLFILKNWYGLSFCVWVGQIFIGCIKYRHLCNISPIQFLHFYAVFAHLFLFYFISSLVTFTQSIFCVKQLQSLHRLGKNAVFYFKKVLYFKKKKNCTLHKILLKLSCSECEYVLRKSIWHHKPCRKLRYFIQKVRCVFCCGCCFFIYLFFCLISIDILRKRIYFSHTYYI